MKHGYVEFKSDRVVGSMFYIKEEDIAEFHPSSNQENIYIIQTRQTGSSNTLTTPEEFFAQLKEKDKLKL